MTAADVLQRHRDAGTSAFVPFITAGDPSLDATHILARALSEAGSGIIELGVPFSDPVADGVTNQRAAERALRAGATLHGVLDIVRRLRHDGVATPIVLFTYLNPVHRMGYAAFAAAAAASGVNGTLIVDLPPEEAGEYCRAMRAHSIETVFMVSPTTADDRIRSIDSASTGFVYCAARTGVTGRRSDLEPELVESLRRWRQVFSKPLVVGFGISTPAQARRLSGVADGIVVGSALVDLIAEAKDVDEAADRVRATARGFVAACEERMRKVDARHRASAEDTPGGLLTRAANSPGS